MLGLRPRQRVPSGVTVELWLGISTDEAVRMKDSRDRWMTNRYPLIEAGMSRQDCMDWWAARHDRPLERSACVACPFQSRRRWTGDETQVAGAVRRGGGDQCQDEERAGPTKDAVPAHVADASSRGCRPRRRGVGTGRTEGRLRKRVRRTLWRLRDRPYLAGRQALGGTIYRCHTTP